MRRKRRRGIQTRAIPTSLMEPGSQRRPTSGQQCPATYSDHAPRWLTSPLQTASANRIHQFSVVRRAHACTGRSDWRSPGHSTGASRFRNMGGLFLFFIVPSLFTLSSPIPLSFSLDPLAPFCPFPTFPGYPSFSVNPASESGRCYARCIASAVWVTTRS